MTEYVEAEKPISTVDAAVLTIDEGKLKILLHCRPREPFEGAWALPGGFIHPEEDKGVEGAVRRILKNKAGASGFYLEQLAVFSGPKRDPRGWSMTVAHIALVPREKLKIKDGDDVKLVHVGALPKLAFDHRAIVDAALNRLRGKSGYSTLPTSFLGKTFTMQEMLRAYEVVLGKDVDQSSFRRKMMALDILEDTGESQQGINSRPAKLFRLKGGVDTYDRNLG